METIQQTALRFVCCDYQSPCRELRGKAGVSTLYVNRFRMVVNDIAPAYLKEYFTIKDSFYQTRTAMPLELPTFGSVRYGKRSYSYEGALLWNNLENTFKVSKSAKELRCQILR